MPKTNGKSKKPGWAQALDDHVRLTRVHSWTAIAQALDMTDGGLRHWRNGTREPSMSEFLRLCKAAGAEPATILSDPSDEQRRNLLFCYDNIKSQPRRDELAGTATRLLNEDTLERKRKRVKEPA